MSNNATCRLFVQTKMTGFHRWPSPTENRDYLGSRHRHQFGIKVEIEAPINDDRIIEFHDLIDYTRSLWPTDGELNDSSCETMAATLCEKIANNYGLSFCSVTVDEDGEAGATVTISNNKCGAN